MAIGSPDHTEITEIKGYNGTSLVTLKVDTNGELYAVLRGIFGTTLKTLAVDTDGQLIAILKGASGVNVAVDASGYLTAILKGHDGTNYQTIKTDTSGYIEAKMKGLYNSTVKDVKLDSAGRLMAMLNAIYNATPTALKCDSAGNLLLNLTAQDIAFITSRPYYGVGTSLRGGTTVATNTTTDIFEVSGEKGQVIGGYIYNLGTDITSARFRYYIDDVDCFTLNFTDMLAIGAFPPSSLLLTCICYDTVNNYYAVKIKGGVQFEDKFKITAYHTEGADRIFDYEVMYAKAA